MRKIKQGILAAFMLAVFSAAGFRPSDASAAENLTTQIPAEVTLEGTLPAEAEDFAIILRADDSSNPMPQGSAEGACTLVITGQGAGSFPEIQFSEPGIYHYTIRQEKGSDGACTYDSTEYNLTVYVTNNGAGGLAASSILFVDEESDKSDCASFHNVYETAETETEPETESETESETEAGAETESEMETKGGTEAPKKEKGQQTDTPETGDNTNLTRWIALMGVAVIVLVGAVPVYRKRRNKKHS